MTPVIKKIAGAALTAALVGTAATAQGSQVFFPYIVGGGAVTTVLTVANSTPPAHPGGGDTQLRYIYMYKSGAQATQNDVSCSRTPTNFLSSATNDVQSFDVTGYFGSSTRGVLFNDPSVNNNWNTGAQSWATLSGLQPVRAYGIVHNNNDDTATGFPAPHLYGEAFVFEFASGAAWGYQALEDKGKDGDVNIAPFILANRLPWTFFVPTGRFTFMPTTEFATRFFVMPIAEEMANVNEQGRVQVFPWVATDVAAYDRDGNPVPGFVAQTVTCIGAVSMESMLTNPANALLQNGGWAYLATIQPETSVPGTYDTISAAVIKLEFNKGATFNGQAITGVFNNAFMMHGMRGAYPEE